MLDLINNVINAVSGVLYKPWCVPVILLLGGVILTVRSKFIQVRLLKEAFKVITVPIPTFVPWNTPSRPSCRKRISKK